MTDDWVLRHGNILFVENYEACVSFYRDILGLDVLQEKPDSVMLNFGGGYLKIERGGVAKPEKSVAENPNVMRFNVASVDETATMLRGRGVGVSIETYDWGSIGKFLDPDGNACELRNHFDGFFAPLRAQTDR